MNKALSVFLTTALAVALIAQQGSKTIDHKALRDAGKTEATSREWITYEGNCAETRFSPLKQIDTTNVMSKASPGHGRPG